MFIFPVLTRQINNPKCLTNQPSTSNHLSNVPPYFSWLKNIETPYAIDELIKIIGGYVKSHEIEKMINPLHHIPVHLTIRCCLSIKHGWNFTINRVFLLGKFQKNIYKLWIFQPCVRICLPNGTLWLCQNSYWKWPYIVDFPIKNGDFP